MARICITGSADGLGQLAARELIRQGHEVYLHARTPARAKEALLGAPGAADVLVGDLAKQEETKALANEVNAIGVFDAIIHNAGVYRTSANDLFAVNTIAPYMLTCLIQKPKRLIYLSSDMHQGGKPKLDAFKTDTARITYSDTKLHVLMLCKAVARKWPGVYANALNPGWVPTKMGGRGAPDDLHKGYETQVWLAVSNDEGARVSGRYFFHRKETRYNPAADDTALQDKLLGLCQDLTGVAFPD